MISIFDEAQLWKDFMEDERRLAENRRNEIRKIKRLIDYPFRWIGNLLHDDNWRECGIVSAIPSDYINPAYPTHKYFKILEDGNLVKRQDDFKKFHTLVIQWSTGMEGDSFSGFLYFPLSDGRYWKVNYWC